MANRLRYSRRKIRKDYSYAVDEIADLLDITRDTVFRWIRNEGLRHMPGLRKYLVHSSDLLAFLEQKNQKHKVTCKPGELYCFKCRAPSRPAAGTATTKRQANKTVLVSALCSTCNSKTNKPVSRQKWSKKHPLHPANNPATTQHNGMNDSPPECQQEQGGQLCLNLTS